MIPWVRSAEAIIVPEYKSKALELKSVNRDRNPELKRAVILPKGPVDVNLYLQICRNRNNEYGPPQFDLIALDYVTHYNPEVQVGVRSVFKRGLLNPRGIFFLLVGRNTQGAYDHMRLATTMDAVANDVESIARTNGVSLRSLDGFPFSYQRTPQSTMMWVFGWQTSSMMEKNMTISDDYKGIISRLHVQAVPSAVIAKGLLLKPAQVAAVLAHETMRKKAA